MAAHHKRRHILEVSSVYESIAADEEELLVGIEFVDTKHRNDRIGRALASERYTLNDIVAVLIGLGLQGQRTGRKCRCLGVAAHVAMVLTIIGAIARIVEELCAQALVECPIGLKTLLVAYEQVIEVLHDVGLAEAFRPQTELIDRTFEVAQL